MRAQQEVGFIEKFATSSDRREALKELIPGTEDYFYYHCLHHQNEQQLAQAQAILEQWQTKFGETADVLRMRARQMVLSYDGAPSATIDYLRDKLGVQLDHAPPSRDRAATLASRLAPERLAPDKLIQAALARDPSFGQIARTTLPKLVDRRMAPDQLRAWLQRLNRADIDGLVKRIAEELALQDSAGFGWANIHQLLTLEQLDELLKLRTNLIGHEPFIRTYLSRLAPPDHVDADDAREQRLYLERMLNFVRRLPASQNSIKALVLGNLLRLNLREGKMDRALFVEYLALPRQAPYYAMERLQNQPVMLADLNYVMNPQVIVPPVGDDVALVRRYLEHFFQADSKMADFARVLNRDYLDQILAETKILSGDKDAATWYAKLNPAQQKELRERIELRFGPRNQVKFAAEDTVELSIELKNVPQLLVKIYEVNPRNYFRTFNKPLATDIDLDGLVANAQRQFEYSQPADRRHGETISLPELAGRGVWVVDLLGGGQRSRALIQKGGLSSVQQLSDSGHVLQVYDERGQLVKTAHAEIGDRSFEGDSEGRIVIPYGEQTITQNVLLVDGDFAAQDLLIHQRESYRLQAKFIIDRQALVAGTTSSVLVRAQLDCLDRPTSLELLEKPQLTIVARDLDRISSTQSTGELKLTDSGELVHRFLVPQRMTSLQFTLSGRVYNQSRDERQDVSATETIDCNENLRTNTIGSFYLQPSDQGYRLLVLGRNGEPLPKRPVKLSFTALDIVTTTAETLATDANGQIELGQLPRISSIRARADGVQAATLSLKRAHKMWPTVVHQSTKATLVLPLGAERAELTDFSLIEIKRGVNVREVNKSLKIEQGALRVSPLDAGNYHLHDYLSGSITSIAVVATLSESENYLIGATRALEVAQRQPLAIEAAVVAEKEIRIKLQGADKYTRVHVIAHPLVPDFSPFEQSTLQHPSLMESPRRRASSFYIDSLQLDEEFSYILQRQQATKYPGNLLAQPSLLIHPWEISMTENQSKEAAAGSAVPSLADPKMAAPAPGAARAERASADEPDSVSYDFLVRGTLLAANLKVSETGDLVVPRTQLEGYSSVTVLAVHPTTSDSRTLFLPATPLQKRDLRLKSAFDAQSHLAERQTVRRLKAGEKVAVGDARTSRLQVFTTLADVYRLYGTLLANPEWEKFRFVTQWPELSDEEKRARYSEMSCHELDYFLYRKDRPFFDAVVAPLISQKLDKQLVDLWLIDKPLEAYRALWRTQRLNTLERSLLAQRLNDLASGTQRWLDDYLAANPLDPMSRSQRFERALHGSALDRDRYQLERDKRQARLSELAMGADMAFDGATIGQFAERSRAEGESRPEAADAFFRSERLSRGGEPQRRGRLFQTLDQTREWAETQYYRVRLDHQSLDLVPPNSFWQEFLRSGNQSPFLSENIDLPVSSLNEALLALATIDLPWQSEPAEINVENDRLVVTTKQPAIAYIQSIEPANKSEGASSILVGQEIYLAEPDTDEKDNRPLQDQALLIGVPYRASVVVTNPSSANQQVSVLCQLPEGAMPLSASRVTSSTPVELHPYRTMQVQYSFYFPAAGQFNHYGSQVSSDGKHLANTASTQLRVLAEPETVDETTWSYVADWGSNEQVLTYLTKANLQRLDLRRIAFRMQDRAFYAEVLKLLTTSGRYDPVLWAYALRHKDTGNISQLLHHRVDFYVLLGPAMRSTLLTIDPREQMSHEHLDYKPLVVARIHQLGAKRVVLNDKLFTQYSRLLNLIAHQPGVTDDQRMELCYYALIQNRIEEAITWFDQVKVDQLATRLQYDYFDAYLDFYRGKYERAAQIAERYSAYPVPRWRELFSEISQQVRQRDALLAGQEIASTTSLDSGVERDDRILTDRREAQQSRQAAESPALDLTVADGVATIEYRNLDEVRVNYYLMDIELIFSRSPFVTQSDNRLPAIRPNHSDTLKLAGGVGARRRLELPEEVRNRNVLIEVTAKGISRSSVLTANTLAVTVIEPYGRVQVRSATNRLPVEAAYVKVYAR
ncbi:MAG: hypothetical protein IT423_11445, partial [Pirellulaceae bacterium]|nr:hypothetical protein [Pirellulaceae bacterium]